MNERLKLKITARWYKAVLCVQLLTQTDRQKKSCIKGHQGLPPPLSTPCLKLTIPPTPMITTIWDKNLFNQIFGQKNIFGGFVPHPYVPHMGGGHNHPPMAESIWRTLTLFVSFWIQIFFVQKLTFYISFWIQKLMLWISFWRTRNRSITSVSGFFAISLSFFLSFLDYFLSYSVNKCGCSS